MLEQREAYEKGMKQSRMVRSLKFDPLSTQSIIEENAYVKRTFRDVETKKAYMQGYWDGAVGYCLIEDRALYTWYLSPLAIDMLQVLYENKQAQ